MKTETSELIVTKICPDPQCEAVWHNCPKKKTHCLDCGGNIIQINEKTYNKKFKNNFFQYDFKTHEYYRPKNNLNMENNKHTDGTWWFSENDNSILADPMGYINIAKIHGLSESNDGSANGTLMAKAPEMLQLLEGCYETFGYCINQCQSQDMKDELTAKRENIKHIINQAKGI